MRVAGSVVVGALVAMLLAAPSARAQPADEDGPSVTITHADPQPAFHRVPLRLGNDSKPIQPPLDPSTRPFVALRMSYGLVSAGRFAHAGFGDVFSPGPAGELDGGITAASFGALFIGWQHAVMGLGPKSPYAGLPDVASHDDRGWLGWRSVPSPIYLELAVGYSHLAQSAVDMAGSHASFSVDALMARFGGGLSKPMLHRRARLAIGIEYSLGVSLGNATATATVGSQTTMSSGTLESSYRGTVSLETQFQFAF